MTFDNQESRNYLVKRIYSSWFLINEILNSKLCAYWRTWMCLNTCFCTDFKKICWREASNLLLKLEEIVLLCCTQPLNYAIGVVYDIEVVPLNLCMMVGGKMDKMSRINVWWEICGYLFMSLLLKRCWVFEAYQAAGFFSKTTKLLYTVCKTVHPSKFMVILYRK